MTIEIVTMSDYEIRLDVNSKLGLNQMLDICMEFICPRCGHHNTMLDHGETGQCPECELYFQLWGINLHCGDGPFKEPRPRI